MKVYSGINWICFLMLIFSGFSSSAQDLSDRMDSVSYAAGVSIALSFQRYGAADVDLDILTKAIRDVMGKQKVELKIDKSASEKIFNTFITEVKTKPGKDFLINNAKKEGVSVLPSGLQYKIISKGQGGATPGTQEVVKTHYKGMLIDGTVFDSSIDKGDPGIFPVNKVIKGWTEGLQLMSVGDKYVFYIPYELGYGEKGFGGKIPPYSTLIFEVELLEIIKN